jgi:hypothetical protein
MAPRYVALSLLTVGLVFTTSPVAARNTEARPTASHSRGAAAPVVPLRVQRLLKERVPAAAYAPTRLPAGYRYVKYENINRTSTEPGSISTSAAAANTCRCSALMPSLLAVVNAAARERRVRKGLFALRGFLSTGTRTFIRDGVALHQARSPPLVGDGV